MDRSAPSRISRCPLITITVTTIRMNKYVSRIQILFACIICSRFFHYFLSIRCCFDSQFSCVLRHSRRMYVTLIERDIASLLLLLFLLQEMVCNAPPLAWPWNVNAQSAAATKQQMVSDPSNASSQPPPLTLTKSSILSENKTNCGNSPRNKRNCAQPDNGSHTVNKRNRSSNNCM